MVCIIKEKADQCVNVNVKHVLANLLDSRKKHIQTASTMREVSLQEVTRPWLPYQGFIS